MSTLLLIVGIFIHLQDSTRHLYVEVVLNGQTEGKFLDDPHAHRDEIMGQVSRLGGLSRSAATQEADDSAYRNV